MNRRDFVTGAVGAAAVAGSVTVGEAKTAAGSAGNASGATGSADGNDWHVGAGRGFNAPLRFDASIDDCEVAGTIPEDMDGAFYRVGGEFYYPPKFPDDAPLNADGYISMFRVKNGKVDFRGRYVETHRFQMERQERRQLYGYYRNPYTDDPLVKDPEHPNKRTVANTAPIVHAGKLYTIKEDGLPHEMNPNTLETVGPWDFNGGWKSETFTAHPKMDPVSGDMMAFGYEATGLCSDDLWIYRVDKNGDVAHEIRTKVPYVSVIHDQAITQKHIIIPFSNYVTKMEWLKEGKIHWWWDKSKPGYIGVLRRDGDGKDIRWFKGPSRCMMHTLNAHDEGDKVILYAPFWDGNFFPFFPNTDGSPFNPKLAKAFIRKITLDMNSKKDTWEEEILWPMDVVDLGKVDPRILSLETRYFYTSFNDPERPFDKARAGVNANARVVNSYGRFDLQTGKVDKYFAGDTHSLQEVSFVPRKGSTEGDGYLVGVANNYAEDRSEMVIVDAQNPAAGDIARVIMPFKLSSQVHGVWASADELPLT